MIAAGQITYRMSAISNWNFWFCRFKSVWLQTEFFEVSLSISDLVPDEGRDLLKDILSDQMMKIELDFIAHSVMIKLIPTRGHEFFESHGTEN